MKQIRLENFKNEYPPMPAEIHDLIQREVALQTKAISPIRDRNTGKQSARFSWKKVAIAVLAATMVLGVPVLAGEAIGHLRVQKAGEHALNVGVTPVADAPSSIPEQIPRLSLKAGYIPEGYCSGEASSAWDVYPAETPYQNGLSTGIFTLGEEITEKGFPLTIDYVLYSEEISWQDRTALYVELQKPYWDAPMKRIYIPLPEYWQGLIVYAWENTSKEEMIKYAENLEVIREEGTLASAGRLGWVEHAAEYEPSLDYGTWTVPADRLLKRLHPVGETFPLLNTVRKVSAGAELTACVKKVEVFNDFSPLDPRYLDDTGMEPLGDRQKLVYVTVEYTNTSDRDLQNIADCSAFCCMIEKDGNYVIYDRAQEDGDPKTDYIMENGSFCYDRTIYVDACMGDHLWERRVIPEIKAGENVTVHIAGVVNEDELDKLYLNFGGGELFSEQTLAGGYVDLRR